MLLTDIVQTSAEVKSTRSRLAKITAIASLLERMDPADVEIGVLYLSGEPRQEKTGLGYAAVGSASTPPADVPTLSIAEVDASFERMSQMAGPGSQRERLDEWSRLLAAATVEEQAYLQGLALRNLRQGALEGLVLEAVAKAARVEPAEVRRAFMVSGDLGAVSHSAMAGGAAALAAFRLTLFRPVLPMLAQSAEAVADAVDKAGAGSVVAVETKIDGARIQVHRRGDEVRVYTRNLREITGRVPGIVQVVAALEVESVILDGEAVSVAAEGRPAPFQETMSRFGTKTEGEGSKARTPLTGFFFDCIHLNGTDLIDASGSARRAAMARVLPPQLIIDRLETAHADQAQGFFDRAIATGHEGVVVKALDAPYEAGRRGASWVKVKPVHTLDLVVLAVEWGSGRRQAWLSNLHLGARDLGGGFVMLGKTFKGMTDEMLQWQTERFLELETRREGHVVHVRPEQVVEVAIDGVQASSRYPGGVALRFARVKGYRDDKSAEEADTIDTVQEFLGR